MGFCPESPPGTPGGDMIKSVQIHSLAMRIDAHVHMWERRSLPDMAVINYLEPVKKLQEYGLDEAFDFKLDDPEFPFPDYDEKTEMYIEVLDANRIDYMVILPIDFWMVNEHRMTNDEYMEWTMGRCALDDRFLPFISVDPQRPDAIDMLNRYFRKYTPKGIKVYPATGWYPDDPKYDEFWRTIDDMGLVVTTHTGMALPPLDEKYCHPKNLTKVVDRYPDMKLIVAHLGGKFHDELFPLMEGRDNVYSDCSALQGWWGEDRSMIGKRLHECMTRFPDRIVYGSDIPIYEFAVSSYQFIRTIEEGDWGTDKMKADLLGNNMARILGL